MSTDTPTLMDILSPPHNPWLESVVEASPRVLPQGVRFVQFDGKGDQDDPDDLDSDDVEPSEADLKGGESVGDDIDDEYPDDDDVSVADREWAESLLAP